MFIFQKKIKQAEAAKVFEVGKFNWITETRPDKKELQVKIRHGAKFYECEIDFIDEQTAQVKLETPDQGIAPGQFAVFYKDQFCLGGGVIL